MSSDVIYSYLVNGSWILLVGWVLLLLLAFFAFQSLPINYAGLLLIILGLALLIAEIKFVSHGVLAIGGVVAMGLGSLMLFDAPEASGLRISASSVR